MLNQSEVDLILKNRKISDEPYITLNDILNEHELKELRKAIKKYADENLKKIEEMSSTDMYFIAKQLNFDKFIFHDKQNNKNIT